MKKFYKTKTQGLDKLNSYQVANEIAGFRDDAIFKLFHELKIHLEKRAEDDLNNGQKKLADETNALNKILGKAVVQTAKIWELRKPKILDQIPIDIVSYVKEKIGEEQEEVLFYLYDFCSEHDDFSFRLARCILFLSKGDIEAIGDIIWYINTPEDLIINAEYEDKVWKRNFTRPFGNEEVRDGDLDTIQMKFLQEKDDLPF